MGGIELDCSAYDAQTDKEIPMEDLDFEDKEK